MEQRGIGLRDRVIETREARSRVLKGSILEISHLPETDHTGSFEVDFQKNRHCGSLKNLVDIVRVDIAPLFPPSLTHKLHDVCSIGFSISEF
jgi:hypothetical protein